MNDSHMTREKRVFSRRIKEARIGDPSAQYDVSLMYANGAGVERNVEQALVWIKAAAERGHTAAQYLLGSAYAGGVGAEKDEQKAVLWFLRAAEQGNGKALLRLAKVFGATQATLAYRCCLKAAEQGMPEAQLEAGDCCAYGIGVAQDHGQACIWYRMAADQGLAAAQFALGQMYALGQGVARDLAEACVWYRMASRQGHAPAQVALARLDAAGHGRTEDPKRGRKRAGARERRNSDVHWVDAAERGSPDDRYHLGLMYEAGLGVEKNIGHARRWYQKAAKQGHINAQVALAKLCEVDSPALAATWYGMAAEQGHVEAQFAMGRLHARGEGFRQDPLKSLVWWARAADQRHAPALVDLGKLLLQGDEATALACYELAAQNGVVEAQCVMGQRFLTGDGVVRDVHKAAHWYRLAADQGSAEAQCALAGLCIEGKGVKKDLAQGLLWYEKAASQGFAKAQWNLGGMHATGGEGGVGRDARRATLWCKKAAAAGFGPAQATLGTLFAQAKKYDRAVYWWEKAAEQNDPEALFNLANACHSGLGVAKDDRRAFLLLIKAADHAVPAAQARLGLMYATGQGVPPDQLEAGKWFIIASTLGDENATANCARARGVMSPAQFAEADRRAAEWLRARKISTG